MPLVRRSSPNTASVKRSKAWAVRGFQCLIGAGAVAASLPAGGRRDGETVDDEAGHEGCCYKDMVSAKVVAKCDHLLHSVP